MSNTFQGHLGIYPSRHMADGDGRRDMGPHKDTVRGRVVDLQLGVGCQGGSPSAHRVELASMNPLAGAPRSRRRSIGSRLPATDRTESSTSGGLPRIIRVADARVEDAGSTSASVTTPATDPPRTGGLGRSPMNEEPSGRFRLAFFVSRSPCGCPTPSRGAGRPCWEMIPCVVEGADSDADGSCAWAERLGWAFGLIAEDPVARGAALTHLVEVQGKVADALARPN